MLCPLGLGAQKIRCRQRPWSRQGSMSFHTAWHSTRLLRWRKCCSRSAIALRAFSTGSSGDSQTATSLRDIAFLPGAPLIFFFFRKRNLLDLPMSPVGNSSLRTTVVGLFVKRSCEPLLFGQSTHSPSTCAALGPSLAVLTSCKNKDENARPLKVASAPANANKLSASWLTCDKYFPGSQPHYGRLSIEIRERLRLVFNKFKLVGNLMLYCGASQTGDARRATYLW